MGCKSSKSAPHRASSQVQSRQASQIRERGHGKSEALMNFANVLENPLARRFLEHWAAFLQRPNHYQVDEKVTNLGSVHTSSVPHPIAEEVGKAILDYLHDQLVYRQFGGKYEYCVVGQPTHGVLQVDATIETAEDTFLFKLLLRYDCPSMY
jgi:hypothetical protein